MLNVFSLLLWLLPIGRADEPGHCALLQTTQLERVAGLQEVRKVNASTLEAMKEEVRREGEMVFTRLQETWKSSSTLDPENLAATWYNAYVFTAEETLKSFEDGTVFVSTGDISQMWLRDSVMQLHVYLPLAARAAEDSPVRQVLEAAMVRQIRFFLSDPYASAFFETSGPGENQGPSKKACPPDTNCPGCKCHDCLPACGAWTYQTEFELDSPLFVLLLHHEYWKKTGSVRHLSEEFHKALRVLVRMLKVEQYHQSKSSYNRMKAAPSSFADGIGLIWSQSLPSDNAEPPYNVPQNLCRTSKVLALTFCENKTNPLVFWVRRSPHLCRIFERKQFGVHGDILAFIILGLSHASNAVRNIMAAVLLQKGAEICHEVLHDAALADELLALSSEVEEAVNRFGIVDGPHGEKIFAFQVDGKGSATLMDDATESEEFCFVSDW